MKLGFVTSILDEWDYDGVLDVAHKLGFSCLEVACWPQGKAERRYAGVSHIDTDHLTPRKAVEILQKTKDHGLSISSLAYYPNTMDGDEGRRENAIAHLHSVIDASHLLGVNLVTTFIGRDQQKTVEENIDLFSHIWPEIIHHAGDLGVRIAIENCPMLFDGNQWPGGQNLFVSPAIWRQCFSLIVDKNFGLNYDPSHFIWQQMDYLKPIHEFKDRIFHIHFKDIKIRKDLLDECGILAYPLSYMEPKLPGQGDIDWGAFVGALNDIGYDGNACIEVEDRAFEGSREKILNALRLSKRYLEQYVI